MMDVWEATGRLAQAAIVGTCMVPIIALALHGSLRRSNVDQRYRVWRAATVLMLSAILLAPLVPWRAELAVPRTLARAAYGAGVPVTELVGLRSEETGVTHPKRLVRRTIPETPWRALLVAWMLGSLVVAVRIASSYRKAARLASLSSTAPTAWAESLTARVPQSLRTVRATVQIAPAHMPAFTWGELRPRIMLPASLLERPDDAALVLAHELHHVRSHDFAVQVCTDLLACLAWWNPAVWLVRRRIGTEREYAADAAVLAAGADPCAYAACLLAAASSFATLAPEAAGHSTLAHRVQRIAVWEHKRWAPLQAALSYGFATLLAGCAVLAMWSGLQGSIGANDAASVNVQLVQVPSPDAVR